MGSEIIFDVGIPFYGCLDYLIEAIKALEETTHNKYRLLLYDDGTPVCAMSNNLIEVLREMQCRGLEIEYTYGGKNHGVPWAFNELLDMSTAPILCLLNSDTVPFTHWDVPLLEGLATLNRVGCIGPSTNYADIRQIIFSPSIPCEMAQKLWKKKSETYGFWEMEKLTGFCFMFTREYFEEVGWFDEWFSPGQYEETDFMARGSRKGYKHYLAKDSFVYHHGHVTLDSIDSRMKNETLIAGRKKFEQKRDAEKRGAPIQEVVHCLNQRVERKK